MVADSVLPIGRVVADRYRIDAVLGEGGMGVVYRAEHLHLRKALALKVLLPKWCSTAEVVARFEREAMAAVNIQSAHVAAATDFGRLDDGSFFLVMEYVKGRTLRSVLEAGALEPLRAVRILRQIASALEAAHRLCVVHRDLKPENVMLVERDGDTDFVKVLDFGIATVGALGGAVEARATPLTQAGAVVGTPEYMPPEQALGQPVDGRSDLYSAGVIFFEMLTGRCPFEGGAVTVLRQHVLNAVPELPASSATSGFEPRLATLVRRLLAKRPEDRFASASELIAALDECSATPVLADAGRSSLESMHGMATPVARRERWMVGGVVAAVVLAASGALIVLRSGVHEAHDAPSAAATTRMTSSAEMPTSAPGPPASTPSEVDPPLITLPPPPVPSSSASTRARPSAPPTHGGPTKPASSPGHRTGPGGIYIPPPSEWFK